jgi:thiol-disulfide isomerase/thioredoxin
MPQKSKILAIIFALLALLALSLKLPELGPLFLNSVCTTCSSNHPFLIFFGAGYFAFVFSLLISSRLLEKPLISRLGLTFAIGLALGLTAVAKSLCTLCLIAHTLHIAMWTLLLFNKQDERKKEEHIGLKVSSAIAFATSTVAILILLNFTLALYGLTPNATPELSFKVGDKLEGFEKKREHQKVILSFISDGCPYCKEQLKVLDTLSQKAPKEICFIAIGTSGIQTLKDLAPHLEFREDPALVSLLKISAFPTLVILDQNMQVQLATQGMPSDLVQVIEKFL